MPSVRTHGLSFDYSSDRPILTSVSLHLPQGWTGVTGPNGEGKTTLLRLLASELEPDSGHVSYLPDPAVVVYAPQRVGECSSAIDEFSLDWEGHTARLRSLLALEPDDLARWETLSYGERKRWQLGACLARQPDILLLDEPTNHLDAEARDLVFDVLQRFEGVGVVVSHDRLILNHLCGRTLFVERGDVTVFPGPYDEARQQRRADRESAERDHQKQVREVRRVRKRLGDARRLAHSAEANISASKRVSNPKDHDARSMLAKKQALDGAAHTAQQVSRTNAILQRAEQRRDESAVRKELGGSLTFRLAEPEKRHLLSVSLSELKVPGRVLARSVSVALNAGDRLRIAGPNGAGKSTLLRILREQLERRRTSVLYLGQDSGEHDSTALREYADRLPEDERGHLMQIVAALGVAPEHVLHSERLSPGEARKLQMARGLAQGVGVVLLDEPTNHLDLPSIERLEEALAGYPGAIVVVTHDDRFAREIGVVTECWLDGRGGPARLRSPDWEFTPDRPVYGGA